MIAALRRHRIAWALPLALVAGAAAACVGPGPIGFVPRAPAWLPDQRLTFANASAQTSRNWARTIATDGAGNVAVVWFDTRSGTPQVYIKRSADGGATWGADTRLSLGAAGSEHPAFARSGQHLYVTWYDRRNGRPDVYVRHSADGGATWGPETLITRWAGDGELPSIAASGATVRLAYESGRDGTSEVYTAASTDSGATWGTETRVSDVPYESWVATVELAGQDAYIAWVDYRDGNEEEYFRRSTDGGATWQPIVRLTTNPADSWAPSLAVAGSVLHLVWFDRRDAGVTDQDVEATLDAAMALIGLPYAPPPPRDPSVYYLPLFQQRFDQKLAAIRAAGPAWVAGGGDPARLQALVTQAQALYTRWSYGWSIYYKRSEDGGATWGPDTRLTYGSGPSMRPSIAALADDLHIVWFDGRSGSMQVYAKESVDGGRTWGADTALTAAQGNPLVDTMRPSVAVSAAAVYVVWYDQRGGSGDIYFKRYQ